MASEYLVRVKFRDKLRFVNFFENELKYDNFLNKGKMLYLFGQIGLLHFRFFFSFHRVRNRTKREI